jgi:hypothetical protein
MLDGNNARSLHSYKIPAADHLPLCGNTNFQLPGSSRIDLAAGHKAFQIERALF